MGYWVNFAATGDPNARGAAAWPRFSNARPRAMRLDTQPGAMPIPNLRQLGTLEAYYAWRRAQAGHQGR